MGRRKLELLHHKFHNFWCTLPLIIYKTIKFTVRYTGHKMCVWIFSPNVLTDTFIFHKRSIFKRKFKYIFMWSVFYFPPKFTQNWKSVQFSLNFPAVFQFVKVRRVSLLIEILHEYGRTDTLLLMDAPQRSGSASSTFTTRAIFVPWSNRTDSL